MIRLEIDVPLSYVVISGAPNTFQDLLFQTNSGAVFWQSRGGFQRATDNMELITAFYDFPVSGKKPGDGGEIQYSNIRVGHVSDTVLTSAPMDTLPFTGDITERINRTNLPHEWIPTPTAPYGPHRMGQITSIDVPHLMDYDRVLEVEGIRMGTLKITLDQSGATIDGSILTVESRIDIEIDPNKFPLLKTENPISLTVEFMGIPVTSAILEPNGERKWFTTVSVADIGQHLIKVDFNFQ